MDLILWRHADAEDGEPDLNRCLSKKGKRQAKHVAQWLREHLEAEHCRVWASQAVRSQETAAYFSGNFMVFPELNPDSSPAQLLPLMQQHAGEHEVLLMVGHQPWLGQFAAQLSCGVEASWSLRKGAFFWLQENAPFWRLHAALCPSLLK